MDVRTTDKRTLDRRVPDKKMPFKRTPNNRMPSKRMLDKRMINRKMPNKMIKGDCPNGIYQLWLMFGYGDLCVHNQLGNALRYIYLILMLMEFACAWRHSQ